MAKYRIRCTDSVGLKDSDPWYQLDVQKWFLVFPYWKYLKGSTSREVLRQYAYNLNITPEYFNG